MRLRLLVILAVSSSLFAGAKPPVRLQAGILLPVTLDRALDSRKVQTGQEIRAEIMQDVPDSGVRRRSHVLGHVISVQAPGNVPAEITLRFDAVEQDGKRFPLSASLRALASFTEVGDAQTPEEALDRGLTPETANYTQIGGEQVYRGGGPVTSGIEVVGTPVPYGVLARPRPNAELGCRGTVGGNQPQALWVFSTDACGVYGLPHVRIVHAGRTIPLGTIVLQSDAGRLQLPGGTGMLLRVQGSDDQRP